MRHRRSCHGDVLGVGAAVAGFTLLELMIVVTIIGIIATIGVPQYVSALRIARIGKAKHDLVTISHEIDRYAASNEGHWPLTLYQIGFGGRLDPWGTPYCYLNYADGTGDGLEWAISAGLVDPAALLGQGPKRPGMQERHGGVLALALPARFGRLRDASMPQGPVGGAGAAATGGAGAAVTGGAGAAATGGAGAAVTGGAGAAATAVTSGARATGAVSALEHVAADTTGTTTHALPNVLEIAMRLPRELTMTEVNDLGVLRTSPGFNMFAAVPTETTRRRDRYMFPLNTDYDLFSLGPDGRTTVSLGEGVGLDDVIRANNGGFFGTASEY